MQAIVFYKREWLTESKTQLEMALREDPDNTKYRSSLDKLNLTISGAAAGGAQQQNQGGAFGGNTVNNGGGYGQPRYDEPQQQQPDMANCLSTCCCAYCLTDCLCSAMRCC